MGGLGNGRRGGRSPPLMIGALIACILVLGFNYWVSSSRNLELQTKLYELEGQVRRGAAERGIAEMKKNEFQEEIQRQKEQISHIESLYKRQLEGAQNTCSQEKGTLQQNISSSTKTIQELKGQLNQLNDDLGKLQKELQSCQGNIKTLNNKLMYDMTHCQSQVLSQKELCDERVAAAKLEVQKKREKLTPPPGVSSQDNTVDGAVKEDGAVVTVADAFKTATVESHTPSASQPKENEPPELLTNEIIVDKASVAQVDQLPAKDLSKVDSQSVPSAASVKQDVLPPPVGDVVTEEGEAETSKLLTDNLTEDKNVGLMDAQTEEADPGMEGMLVSRVKADETTTDQKPEGLEEYDADERVVDDVKQQQSKQTENMDLEEELADYNGDDENEGEFEADKQAELARV
ncbi:Golgi membrane protein 1 Golgi membrane protein GP73 Golgi phosphoprotein 2 [Larimichthys crocea]|uniref:Golgi membrane protein 1 Golgi membrane protein GP73 Golgi phosphoprotein 2 n=1 Tax=Larimichthys crocea TaxID=215358 RepID=A0A6G0IL84_LARCR|nr:Golgi membrane protein 1 Golgi membrane protein GP73 Golgi phosphoprotein 2 [Larimichthys crocea]